MTTPPPMPDNVRVYVDAIGVDATITFILHFGGSEVFMSHGPSRSELVVVLGQDAAQALADVHAMRGLPARVPVARKWLAQVLFAKGLSKNEIARRIRVSDVMVRSYLAPPRDDRQSSLF
jgi:hypothetical protein